MLHHVFLALSFVLLAFSPNLSRAQGYPDYTSTSVNDFADLLPAAQEEALSERLDALRAGSGVEMTVVTLDRFDPFAPREDMSIEQFATGLFNHWGVGDAARNDGVMVLVARGDRVMRIELGRAYGRDWDRAAANVIDDHFLPAFRQDRYASGIMEGSEAVIAEIVEPFLAGDGPPKGPNAVPSWALFGGIGALFAAGVFGGAIRNRLRRCAACGRRGQIVEEETTMTASYGSSGAGLRRITCPHCGHKESTPFVIPRRSRSRASGSFGGGSSGGGGASGRW